MNAKVKRVLEVLKVSGPKFARDNGNKINSDEFRIDFITMIINEFKKEFPNIE